MGGGASQPYNLKVVLNDANDLFSGSYLFPKSKTN